jgi:hypothetical protein
MRVILVNTRADVAALDSKLGVRTGRTLETLEKLNPHVDFTKVEPGTVILVPDNPAGPGDTGDKDDRSIQAKAFADLRVEVAGALDASSARVRRGYDVLAEEAKEVTATLKSAPIKRAIEADQELKVQVDAAAAVFKQDAADAKSAEQTLRSIKERMDQELDALAKLLG